MMTHYNIAGFNREDASSSWDVCTYNEAWALEGNYADMPASLTGVLVYGVSCDYTETSSYSDAKKGDTVGKLSCPYATDATCIKVGTSESTVCDTYTLVEPLVSCSWS